MVRSIECGRYICTYQSYVVVDVDIVVVAIAIVVTVGSCIFSITFPVYAPSLTLLGRISLSFAIKYSQFRTKYLLNQPNKHMSVEASDKIHHAIVSIYSYIYIYVPSESEWERERERKMWKSELTRKCEWIRICSALVYILRARYTKRSSSSNTAQHHITEYRESFGKMLKGSGQVAWTKQLYDYCYYCAATSDHSHSCQLHKFAQFTARKNPYPILDLQSYELVKSTNKTNSTHFTCVFLEHAHAHAHTHILANGKKHKQIHAQMLMLCERLCVPCTLYMSICKHIERRIDVLVRFD